jgi:hypothetical protein
MPSHAITNHRDGHCCHDHNNLKLSLLANNLMKTK